MIAVPLDCQPGNGEHVATGNQLGGGRRFLYHWCRRETVRRALKVAAIVGPLLTIINQYDMLFHLEFSPRLFLKIALTFLVPYSVSSYSSARAYMEQERSSP